MKSVYMTSMRRKYGMSIKEMAAKYHCTEWKIWSLHKLGKLHAFIEEQEKKEKVGERG